MIKQSQEELANFRQIKKAIMYFHSFVTGGTPSLSVTTYRTVTNAPNINKLDGSGYQIGGSIAVPVYKIPLAASADFNIIPDSTNNTTYFGATVSGGLGVPGGEFHIEWVKLQLGKTVNSISLMFCKHKYFCVKYKKQAAPIDCFDVNEKGLIAIGSSDSEKKTISVYSTEGTFLYGYRFTSNGSFGLEWERDNTQASAIIYSITETVRANNLNVYYYIKHLLTHLPQLVDENGNIERSLLEPLMPWSKTLPADCYSKRRS